MDKQTRTAPPAGPTYRVRPRRREFLITVASEEVERPSGFGLTLDDVLTDLVGAHERSLAEGRLTVNDNGRDDPRDMDDLVIWGSGRHGSHVLAVLRPDAEGTRMDVVRFDGPPSAPGD